MINFGTDGWRGVIADDFTFERLWLVGLAISRYAMQRCGGDKPILIGYDTRFLSDRFAQHCAKAAVLTGLETLVVEDFTPTPAVSYGTVNMGTEGAMMITASHNPARYNGIKYKAGYGGSASTEITGSIEEELRSLEKEHPSPPDTMFEELVESGEVKMVDLKPAYLDNVLQVIDRDVVRGSGVRVVYDPMYGAGQGYLSEILGGLGLEVEEIHNVHDPLFGGINPEPFGENMNELRDTVVGGYDVGIAVDGDADRACAIDATGEFISSHKVFSILLRHLVEYRGWSGKVVKTVSTTSMIDKLCRRYGLELEVVPVGFKYICDLMLAEDVLIGGEESGGVGIKNYLPERDGILMGMLLVEVMAQRDRTLGELVRELETELGEHHYVRRDIEIGPGAKSNLLAALPGAAPREIGGVNVVGVVDIDGRKFIRSDESWLMLRVSGTEAVVRVYAEAGSPEEASGLASEGERLIAELAKGG